MFGCAGLDKSFFGSRPATGTGTAADAIQGLAAIFAFKKMSCDSRLQHGIVNFVRGVGDQVFMDLNACDALGKVLGTAI